jgi:tetratricopeptide (TPR) repeat protein
VFPFDHLIEHHLQSSTGGLSLNDGKVEKAFIFKNGVVTFIQSNLRDETLGSLLVKLERITEEQHAKVVERMVETGKLQGDTLVEMGLLGPSEVFEWLSKQMHEKLKNAVGMGECKASFATNTPPNLPEFQISFFRAMLDGLLAFYPPNRFKEEGGFKRDLILKVTDAGKDVIEKYKLKPEELRELRNIDGESNLGDIIAKSTNKRLLTAMVFLLRKLKLTSEELIASNRIQEPAAETKSEEAKPKGGLNDLFDKAVDAIDYKKEEGPSKEDIPVSRPDANAETQEMYATLLRMQKLDYYELLDLPKEANSGQVERAHTQLVKKFHLAEIGKTYDEKDQAHANQLLDIFTTALTILTNLKKREAYLKQLQESHEKQPECDNLVRAEVAHLKSATLLKFNNLAQALEAAELAIELHPEEHTYCVRYAQIRMKIDIKKEGKPSKLVEEKLRKAIELKPQHYAAYLEMGHYHKLQENPDKAVKFFNKALDANPRCRQAETELRLLEKRNEKKSKSLFSSLRKKG